MASAPSPPTRDGQPWRALRLFDLYRLLVAGLFLVLFLSGRGPEVLGRLSPGLFLWVTVAYSLVGLLWGLLARLRRPDYALQVHLQAGMDIVAILLLVHASGGVTSGLGMLMIASIGGTSLLSPGRPALFFAALGSIALLLLESYGQLSGLYPTTAYTQTGLLGALLFGTALLATTLARRARESEALARRRGVDLANLAVLNEHIIERLQSGIVVVDDQGQIRLMNEAAWTLLGDPRTDNPFRLPDICPPLWRVVEGWRETQRPGAITVPTCSGTDRELQARLTRIGSGEDLATLITIEDSEELRRRSQDLKLASLGRLTASIAHEIRNPLGAISHAAQLLAESPALAPQDRRLAEIIQSHSRRVNEVIRNVLQLSRREPPRPERLRLKPWLEAFAESFRGHEHMAPDLLSLTVSPEDTEVVFDPSQLHQLLWNLCTNAVHHGGADGGRVELQAGLAPGGRRPFLDVIDYGPGISAEARERLFEPFYTTRPGGTGLGLYIARQLCENNGGRLEYLPVPTGGSCFRIEFPDPATIPDPA